MKDVSKFVVNHKTPLAVMSVFATLLASIVCIQVFLIDSDGHDDQPRHEGPYGTTLSEEKNDTKGHEKYTDAPKHFFQEYTSRMNHGDPLAVTLSVIIALATLRALVQLLWPRSKVSEVRNRMMRDYVQNKDTKPKGYDAKNFTPLN